MFKIKTGSIWLAIMLMVIVVSINSVAAQSKQTTASPPTAITFINAKWKDIEARAKKEGKYIFVDAFTTWCEPCRKLKKVTFKDKNASAYFNNNFVSYTIDMEKGEGLALADAWNVTAYPTLLFFTPEGKLIMTQVGYVDGKQLMEIGKEAITRN